MTGKVLCCVLALAAGFFAGTFTLLWAIDLAVQEDPEWTLGWMLRFFSRRGYSVVDVEIPGGVDTDTP